MALSTPCATPSNLAGGVTAQDLVGWTMGWINAFACERGKRAALLDAWPR